MARRSGPARRGNPRSTSGGRQANDLLRPPIALPRAVARSARRVKLPVGEATRAANGVGHPFDEAVWRCNRIPASAPVAFADGWSGQPLYAGVTGPAPIPHGGVTGLRPSSGRIRDRSIVMIIDIVFFLGGLGLFGLAGCAVAAAERL